MRKFLEHLWKDQSQTEQWYGIEQRYGEIRCISRLGERTQQMYFPLTPSGILSPDGETLEDVVTKANARKYDVYFGVLPRTRTDGKAESTVNMTRILWADFDLKHYEGRKPLFSKVMNLPVTPHFIVETGGGFHAYWTLSEHIPVETAETIMRGISKMEGSDKCWDRARIMRLPETTNWKYDDGYGAGPTARLLKTEWSATVHPSAFVDYAFEMTRPVIERRPEYPQLSHTLDETLPGWLQTIIEDGAPKGQRSEAAFKVVCHLVERGYGFERISSLFQQYPYGIGEKYAERNMGDRWLKLTYAAAKRSTGA